MIKIIFSIIISLISFNVYSNNIEIKNDKKGDGIEIINHSKVKVHYIGKLETGIEFDNSFKRKKPFTFQIGTRQVIEGWEIGLLGMKEGGSRTIIIPPVLAYGESGAGDIIPPNAKLIFEIKVIEVIPPGYRVLNVKDVENKQNKGFIFIDIRNKNEIKKTGTISGSLVITAFDKEGNLLSSFLNEYRSSVTNTDNVVFISDNGDIASILANGFVEHLGAKNMYYLKGGIQEYLKFKKTNFLQ